MAILKKKISPRRKQFRENIAAERFAKTSEFINSGIPLSVLILIGFVAVCSLLLSVVTGQDKFGFRGWHQIISVCFLAVGIGFAMAVYIYHYNYRIIKNPLRAFALCGLFILLLALTRLGSFFPNRVYLAAACSVTCAIILAIAYDQRFAIGMSLFFAPLVCFAAGHETDFALFLTMAAGILTSCFLLKEIRTRIKLLEVGVFAGAAVFMICFATGLFEKEFVRFTVCFCRQNGGSDDFCRCNYPGTFAFDREGFPDSDQYDAAGLQRCQSAAAEETCDGSSRHIQP